MFGGYLYFMQDRMLFYPSRTFETSPEQAGLRYKSVRIAVNDNEEIHAWYFDAASNGRVADPARTIIFCHGNAGNISHRLETVEFWLRLGANVLLFDYRGYGQSDGRPSEKGLYEDVAAAYDWLVDNGKADPSSIVAFGRSLGGAVAVDLASRRDCSGLMVESSFSSLVDMGRHMFPFFPVKLLLKYDFDSISKIRNLNCAVVITHSPDDDMIPYEQSKRLYDAAADPRKFVDLSGLHNDREYLKHPDYIEACRWLLVQNPVQSRSQDVNPDDVPTKNH